MRRLDFNKNPSTPRLRWAAAAVLLAAATVSGCASVQDAQLEQAARDRAQQRWQALIRQDFQAAYAMHSEGWRGLNPYTEWRDRFDNSVQWLAAQSVGSQCEESPPVRCVVRVRVRTQLAALPGRSVKDQPREGEIAEVWILQDGQWWLLPGN